MKNKLEIKSWLVKRILFVAFVIFITYLLIVPFNTYGKLRNIPVLIAECVCILIYASYSMIKRAVLLTKVHNILKKQASDKIKISVVPNVFHIKAKYDIVAVINGKKCNIHIFDSIKKYMKHCIVDRNKIERYLATTMSVKSNKNRAFISQGVTWHEKKPLFMPWIDNNDNEINILVFNKLPNDITWSEQHEKDRSLGNGDVVLSNVFIYDINGLKKLNI